MGLLSRIGRAARLAVLPLAAAAPAAADCTLLRTAERLAAVYAIAINMPPERREAFAFDIDILARQIDDAALARMVGRPEGGADARQVAELVGHARLYSQLGLGRASDLFSLEASRISNDQEIVQILLEKFSCNAQGIGTISLTDAGQSAPAKAEEEAPEPEVEPEDDAGSGFVITRRAAVFGAGYLAFCVLCVGGYILFRFRKRSDVRHPCSVQAIMRHDEGQDRCILVDLSRSGMRISSRATLAPETRVTVILGHALLEGVVQWTSEPFAGVAFDEALEGRLLRAILQRSTLEAA